MENQTRHRTPSSGHPTYKGRALPRPAEDLEDQGLGFDVQTLLGRRSALKAFGVGALALGLAACSATADAEAPAGSGGTSAGEIPDETAGPYPGDGSNGPDVLEQSGIVRSDIRSSFGDSTTTAAGIPMTLELNIKDLANASAPFAGVAVYVWHCDREGNYSMYSAAVENENYLRGVQVADAQGTVRFTSIFPACYTGRWPHIHFEVYPDAASITDTANAIATSQVALPEDASAKAYATAGYESSVKNMAQLSLASDNVFGDDGGASQLGTVTGDVSAGYKVVLDVGVDTRTTPAAGGGAPGGGQGGTPPSGGPGGTPPSGAPGGSGS
ncbi:intradiol ring-cleavage dioxygenase [Paeniglutamicibacter psychrophenolicus]|uniref:Protocatechuate 3,4-dioxygenase beta subunit n=1 Tax=Paeniglutamicibacter psychrophenolicus TaxID=257454 RepID=A0ABS4WBG8_9MICC|nr:intradiol ring-cleavage dioxygenase [Paeniglutamicibacter psychrophenolicus]MBP2373560.1 protocatechuate 3,4-dioxygenase beta subunit [Paeniglutamicibacter psychrophenolicus]